MSNNNIISYQQLNFNAYTYKVMEARILYQGKQVQVLKGTEKSTKMQKITRIVLALALLVFTLTSCLLYKPAREFCKKAFSKSPETTVYVNLDTLPKQETDRVKSNPQEEKSSPEISPTLTLVSTDKASSPTKPEFELQQDTHKETAVGPAKKLSTDKTSLPPKPEFEFSPLPHKESVVDGTTNNLTNHLPKVQPSHNPDVLSELAKNEEELTKASADELKKQKGLAQSAIAQNVQAFKSIHPSLQSDRLFVLEELAKYRNLYAHLTEELKQDLEIALYATLLYGLEILDDEETDFKTEVSKNYDLINNSRDNSENFDSLHPSLRNSKIIVMEALKRNIDILHYIPDHFKEDPDIALMAVNRNGKLYLLSDKFKTNEEFLLNAMQAFPEHFQSVPTHLQNNREFISKSVKANGNVLRFLPFAYKSDGEIILAAVENKGLALQCILKVDMKENIVLAALKNNPEALEFAPDSYKKNEKIILDLLKTENGEHIFQYVHDSLIENKAFVLKAVSINGLILKDLPEELQDDEDVVKTATAQNKKALNYASDRLAKLLDFSPL